jgi:hypothetical protein
VKTGLSWLPEEGVLQHVNPLFDASARRELIVPRRAEASGAPDSPGAKDDIRVKARWFVHYEPADFASKFRQDHGRCRAGACLACAERSRTAFESRRAAAHTSVDPWAVGDGAALCTDAIRKAIAACRAAGGGRVVVPAGRFLTGAIRGSGSSIRTATTPRDIQIGARFTF